MVHNVVLVVKRSGQYHGFACWKHVVSQVDIALFSVLVKKSLNDLLECISFNFIWPRCMVDRRTAIVIDNAFD